MIARILTPDKRTTIEVEGDDVSSLFDAIAAVQEVFGNLTCACGSVNTRLVVRPGKTHDGKPFVNRECRCNDCQKIMPFGIRLDGGMWAKNKATDGGVRGWKTWDELTGGRGGNGDDRGHTHDDADEDQRTPTSEGEPTPW